MLSCVLQKDNIMNVLSLFDGMSCGQLALNRAGIKYDNYFASEIDKYAIKVTQCNYPNTIQLGNIVDLMADELPEIDLLIGGSPCQGLSVGNINRKLLDDDRSKLFYEYVRLLKECKPKYFLLENVEMDKTSETEFTKLLGVEPVKINSSLFSAQRRVRLYWTNIPINTDIKDKGILFKDIIDTDINDFILSDILQSRFKLNHEDNGKRLVIGTTALEGKIGQRDRVYGINNKIPTLTATDYKQPKQVYVNGILRKLTLRESEQLQTVPIGYTDCGASKTQRYKMLGNGWTVDVIAHLFKNINAR
jgi:DNA (cytosine-5)-methyltransferase 3A